jgi:hypothetical protein
MDLEAIKEVNTLVEFINRDNVVSVKTRDSTYLVTKSNGSFFVVGGRYLHKTKLMQLPRMDGRGSFLFFDNSFNTGLHTLTTEVLEVLINNGLVYQNQK